MRIIYIDGDKEVRQRDNDGKLFCPMKYYGFGKSCGMCVSDCSWFSILKDHKHGQTETAYCQSRIAIGQIG